MNPRIAIAPLALLALAQAGCGSLSARATAIGQPDSAQREAPPSAVEEGPRLTVTFGQQTYRSSLQGNDRFGPLSPFTVYFEADAWLLVRKDQRPLAGHIVDHVAQGFPIELVTSARNLTVSGPVTLRVGGEVIGYPKAPKWELEGFHGRLVGRSSEYSFDLLAEGRYAGHAQEAGVESDEEGAWFMDADRLVLRGPGRLAELSGELGMTVSCAPNGRIFFRTSSGLYHLPPGSCLGTGDTVPPDFPAEFFEPPPPPPPPRPPPL